MSIPRRSFVVAVCATAALSAAGTAEAAVPSSALPDLQTVIPTSAFSIASTPAGREFRYTHLVYSAGPAPLEIQPQYSEASGNYQGVQQFFDSAARWAKVGDRRVPDAFVFHAAHGHFHFPLASFGLYQVGADGSPGAPVVMSPKNGFCIADSYIYDNTVPNAGEFVGTQGSCADPLTLRGMSVGAADEYDYRDPGQAIPFDGVPDGTYWFRAITDPNNDLQETNESNNETDVKVTIANGTVTAGEVRHPDTTPPPVTLTAPANGTTSRGAVTLSAQAGPGQAVQFLVDGNPVGTATQTAAPYTFTWDSTTVVDGEHWLAARTVDAQGRANTSEVAQLNVSNVAPPPPTGAIAAEAAVDADGSGTLTTSGLSTQKADDLLLAFVASDGPGSAGGQSVTVSGGGLQWLLVTRANQRPGSSEVWKAVAPSPLAGLLATSTPARAGFHQSIHVVAFANSGGVGASTAAAAASGAPAATLTTTSPGSWVWGVGNDWDAATPRTPASGQSLAHQWVDNGVGDTFWMQDVATPTANALTPVTLADTAPTRDQWNLAAVEVLGGGGVVGPPPADVTPPQVRLSEPPAGARVGGTVRVAAVASDDTGVTSVQFKLDGKALGAPATAPPFSVSWDTTTASQGQHTLTAEASDAAGNVGASAGVLVTVDNSGPRPGAITIDQSASKQGKGTLVTPGLSTGASGEQLLAFVALDGPKGARAQQSTVTGGGLTWTLVERANTQSGASEIWSAKAAGQLSGATFTATPAKAGYDGLLHLVAFRGAAGPGVAGGTGGPSGAPDIYLPGVAAGSWVFAVGNDWDRAVARTPSAGQVLQRQWVDTGAGDTFWVQSPQAPSTAPGLVTIHDTAPTNDQYNYAAAELVAAPAGGGALARTASFKAAAVTGACVLAGGTVAPLVAGTGLPTAASVRRAAARHSRARRAGRRAVRRRRLRRR